MATYQSTSIHTTTLTQAAVVLNQWSTVEKQIFIYFAPTSLKQQNKFDASNGWSNLYGSAIQNLHSPGQSVFRSVRFHFEWQFKFIFLFFFINFVTSVIFPGSNYLLYLESQITEQPTTRAREWCSILQQIDIDLTSPQKIALHNHGVHIQKYRSK